MHKCNRRTLSNIILCDHTKCSTAKSFVARIVDLYVAGICEVCWAPLLSVSIPIWIWLLFIFIEALHYGKFVNAMRICVSTGTSTPWHALSNVCNNQMNFRRQRQRRLITSYARHGNGRLEYVMQWYITIRKARELSIRHSSADRVRTAHMRSSLSIVFIVGTGIEYHCSEWHRGPYAACTHTERILWHSHVLASDTRR